MHPQLVRMVVLTMFSGTAFAERFLYLPLSQGTVTYGFCGYRTAAGRCHGGIDLRARKEVPVYAATDGIVEDTQDNRPNTWRITPEYGNFIRILHPNGYRTIYAHLRTGSILVEKEDRVVVGQQIATSDNSGWSSAPHLHFEVHDLQDRKVDPYGRDPDYPNCGANPLWATCPPVPWSNALVDADADGYTISEGDCMDEGETLEGVPAAAVHPGAEEVCNYTDDNCDGTTDEGFEGVGDLCSVGIGACRREGRMSCTTDFSGIVCSITEPWPPSDETCDGLDNDCDGEADENWALLGSGCTVGVGACENSGVRECAPDGSGLVCGADPLPSSAETCNGLDDDCDGEIDDGSRTCLAGMVAVNSCFCMDVYEASRPNATVSWNGWLGFGVPDDGIPRSTSGVLPWQLVTWGGAVAACARAGKRLCLASEWRTACEGASEWDYPYGDGYDSAICNGWEDAVSGAAPTGSLTACVTPSGIFDLSGNVWEWVDHDLVGFTDMGRMGASYADDGNLLLLGCTVMPFPVTDPNCASETVELDPVTGFPVCGNVASNIGFRCCFGP